MTKGSYDFQQQCKTATSLVKTNQKYAVYVRGAFKRYGTKRNPIVVLDGLDMTVPQGCIYGLLGASGCGKTTLLNCIVGRKRLNSGDIWVLGGKPGCKGSGVPGPRIGYMPQNIGLLESFTISETFKFFGWICNMTSKEVEAKVEFFINLLSLPDANCIVENLSGGQQRRLSLAVALLHEPELLILDEPTVGVDPLLRIKIWNHLMEITEKSNVTVILTTHYIEETKQAHLIGLMRGGYLLAEESPERLLSQYNAHNLEDVFLKLSVMQNITKGRKSSILETICKSIDLPAFSNEIINDDITDIESQKKSELVCGKETSKIVTISKHEEKSYESEYEMQNTENFKNYLPVIKSTHINALIWKNFLWMWRNLPMMAFVIGLPLGQMLLFCLAVGRDPRNLTFSVVNKEMISNECDIPSCNTTTLSCNYFEYLTNHFSMYFDFYTNEEEAIAVVKKGKSWAFLMVHHNFSSALRNRYDLGPLHTDIEDIFASSISVHQDQSSPIVDNYIRANLLKGFIDFIKPQLLSCGLNPRLGDIPIRMKSIYGTDQLQFMDFAAPGVLLTIVFFMAVALTSATVLQENKEGTLERSLINGINSIELLLSQSISTFAVIFCQTLLLISVSFNLFDINQEGSWFLLTVLSLLSGIFGISYGFIVTCICDTERSATFLALGSFFPILNLCGFCWPIESMNKYLKFFAKWLPITQSTQSLRCIMAKGWTITSPEVYIGFIAMIVWTLLFIVISMLVLNKKEKSENY